MCLKLEDHFPASATPTHTKKLFKGKIASAYGVFHSCNINSCVLLEGKSLGRSR